MGKFPNYRKAKTQVKELPAEIEALVKRKAELQSQGLPTSKIEQRIEWKTRDLRKAKNILKQPVPKSAYEIHERKVPKTIYATKDALKRPVQGGRVSSR